MNNIAPYILIYTKSNAMHQCSDAVRADAAWASTSIFYSILEFRARTAHMRGAPHMRWFEPSSGPYYRKVSYQDLCHRNLVATGDGVPVRACAAV